MCMAVRNKKNPVFGLDVLTMISFLVLHATFRMFKHMYKKAIRTEKSITLF